MNKKAKMTGCLLLLIGALLLTPAAVLAEMPDQIPAPAQPVVVENTPLPIEGEVSANIVGEIPVQVQIVLWDGSVHASGEAVLVNLSADGAMLADIQIKPATIPLKPCYMTMNFALDESEVGGRRKGGVHKLSLRADIVRLRMVRFVEIAAKFVEITEEAIQIIESFLHRRLAQLQEHEAAREG